MDAGGQGGMASALPRPGMALLGTRACVLAAPPYPPPPVDPLQSPAAALSSSLLA